jgi:Cu-processing system ATP-binding protein
MIRFSNVSKKFDKYEVLRGIDLELKEGRIIGLLGPNASGKTTLIKTLLGMVVPTSGDIFFMDKSIRHDWEYRNHIGYMPQIGKYPENMTMGQIFEMIEDLRKKDKELDRDLYNSYNLGTLLQKRMGTLSGGTRQKVSAHLAFLFDPKVLVLDEPTAGLDPLSALTLKEKIVKEREKGKLILISSHILSELDDIVDQIIYLEEGKIVVNQPIEQLKEETQKSKLSEAIATLMSRSN